MHASVIIVHKQVSQANPSSQTGLLHEMNACRRTDETRHPPRVWTYSVENQNTQNRSRSRRTICKTLLSLEEVFRVSSWRKVFTVPHRCPFIERANTLHTYSFPKYTTCCVSSLALQPHYFPPFQISQFCEHVHANVHPKCLSSLSIPSNERAGSGIYVREMRRMKWSFRLT